jgi:Fungal protein kinase
VPTQFIITVYPNNDKKNLRRFRTTKIISSYGAEPLRGRGTRVFGVIEIDTHDKEKGSPVVLKDIWIDHDRTREGVILAQLYNQADDNDKKLVEKHFLTTICHGDVWTASDVLDDTQNTLMRGLKVITDHEFELQRKQLVLEKHEAATGSEGLRATSRLHAPHPHLKYAHKAHYRIVFKEEGITVDLIPRFPDVMTILTGTVTGAFSFNNTVYPV